METVQLDLNKLTAEILYEAAKRAVREVVAKHAGHGLDDEIKQSIKEAAHKILQEPEIQELLRNQLIHWIRTH